MLERSLRRVLAVLMICFTVLFVQMTRIQFFDADALRSNPNNTRTIQRDFARDRGQISTADGQVVARSVPIDGPLEYQREYPEGELYAHVVGYLSFNLGAEGVERSYNDDLIGRSPALQLDSLIDLLGNEQPTGEVVLSLRHDLQQIARTQLGERRGSVVALDPRSGDVLALWSWPSFDPNRLASHDGAAVNTAFTELNEAPGNPLRARSFRDIVFPGSTFKVVTMAAGLESGLITMAAPVFDPVSSYTPPLTSRPLHNSGGRVCGGNVVDLLVVSCNTGFAQMAAEYLGPNRLSQTAQQFGFNTVPPFDIPGAVASRFPTDYGDELTAPNPDMPAGLYENTPAVAQAAIGQFDVSATPLQMALVTAAIANDGEIMAPRVATTIKDRTGSVVEELPTSRWQRAMEPGVARNVRTAMVETVQRGTASSMAIPGLEVGAKTGTAQLGTDPPQSHAWMIAFAGPDGGEPDIVVAVVVEAAEGASEQSGGREAGPIARAILEAHAASRGN